MSDYASQFSIRRLWLIFGVSMAIMFGALLWFGGEIYHTKPPMPAAVRSASGQIVYTGEEIQRGQAVWQSTGGMQQGSIWGHGSYVAPDWSADWLHREALGLRDQLANSGFEALAEPDRARIGALLRREMRTGGYDPRTAEISVSDQRATAIATTAAHFEGLFTNHTPADQHLRELYAIDRKSVV